MKVIKVLCFWNGRRGLPSWPKAQDLRLQKEEILSRRGPGVRIPSLALSSDDTFGQLSIFHNIADKKGFLVLFGTTMTAMAAHTFFI